MVFKSVYEMVSPGDSTNESQFLDFFSGVVIKPWWDIVINAGVPPAVPITMIDGLDNRVIMRVGTALGDDTILGHTGFRHFDPATVVYETIYKRTDNDLVAWCGTKNLNDESLTQCLLWTSNNETQTLERLFVHDGTTGTAVNTSITINSLYKRIKLQVKDALATLHVNGILEASATTNLPTLAQQPNFGITNIISTGEKEVEYRYVEVYNE